MQSRIFPRCGDDNFNGITKIKTVRTPPKKKLKRFFLWAIANVWCLVKNKNYRISEFTHRDLYMQVIGLYFRQSSCAQIYKLCSRLTPTPVVNVKKSFASLCLLSYYYDMAEKAQRDIYVEFRMSSFGNCRDQTKF